jgi:hypothetical protein
MLILLATDIVGWRIHPVESMAAVQVSRARRGLMTSQIIDICDICDMKAVGMLLVCCWYDRKPPLCATVFGSLSTFHSSCVFRRHAVIRWISGYRTCGQKVLTGAFLHISA